MKNRSKSKCSPVALKNIGSYFGQVIVFIGERIKVMHLY